jgi:hypothetical protein
MNDGALMAVKKLYICLCAARDNRFAGKSEPKVVTKKASKVNFNNILVI